MAKIKNETCQQTSGKQKNEGEGYDDQDKRKRERSIQKTCFLATWLFMLVNGENKRCSFCYKNDPCKQAHTLLSCVDKWMHAHA